MTHYNSEIDTIYVNRWQYVDSIVVCLIGLGISVSIAYHLSGGVL